MYSLAGVSPPGNPRHRLGYVDVTRAELHTDCRKLQTLLAACIAAPSLAGASPSSRLHQALTLYSGKINFPDHSGQRL